MSVRAHRFGAARVGTACRTAIFALRAAENWKPPPMCWEFSSVPDRRSATSNEQVHDAQLSSQSASPSS